MAVNAPLIDAFIERLHQLQSPAEFRAHWSATIAGLGFSAFTYIGVRMARDLTSKELSHRQVPVYLTTVDPGWEEEYVVSAFFGSDPIIKEALARPLPIVSTDLVKNRELSESERLVIHRGHDFALSRGLTIPIHALGGEIGIMTLFSAETETEYYRCIRAFQHSLHIMAIHFHTAVQDKLGYQDSVLQIVPLTPRELECLHWTAKGKTGWEIGQILTISERTVHQHILNAFAKLRVGNKTHAVAKAVSLGLAAP